MSLGISPGLVLSFIIVLIGIAVLVKGLVIVRQSEVMVIERLGTYSRVLESGINFILPFIEQQRAITFLRYERDGEKYRPVSRTETRIDRRETVMDFPEQPVVTTDNVTVTMNAALYYQIIDPKQTVYEVENMSQAIELLAKTALRSQVGQMQLDHVFSSRDEVNKKIHAAMEEPASKWGVKITRVEVQDITMPAEVEEAMRLQMAAERNRRATVTQAEGEKAAAIAKAEGQKEATIRNAEGDKEAAIRRAEGEKESIDLILGSLGDSDEARKTVVGYLLGQSYIKMLPDMAKDGERVFVPYEASAMVGSIGMFRDVAGTPEQHASRLTSAGVSAMTGSVSNG